MSKRRIDPNKPRIKLPKGKNYLKVKDIVLRNKLHTICQSGHCPNMAECWGNGTATFMILGNICTRSCKFCSVKTGKPEKPDKNEPNKITEAVVKMQLKHCVITSVDRDDLNDGGSMIWAETIKKIHEKSPKTTIETLIPDFDGKHELINKIIDQKPEIISHNLETVERLSDQIRSKAKYKRSLSVLKYISEKDNKIKTKSGIMAGLGETQKEIEQTFDDLIKVNCQIITIGQYLRPTKDQLPVNKYYSEEEFSILKNIAISKGFQQVESSKLVRSSYHSEKHLE